MLIVMKDRTLIITLEVISALKVADIKAALRQIEGMTVRKVSVYVAPPDDKEQFAGTFGYSDDE